MEEINTKIIAIDFDGTLCLNGWPDISKGTLAHSVVTRMQRELLTHKCVFILWTCRDGKWLEEAKEFCKKHRLPIFLFNENWEGIKGSYACWDARKI